MAAHGGTQISALPIPTIPPCLTVRPNTERPITITHGTNRLVTPALLPAAAEKALADGAATPAGELPVLWDGKAGPRIATVIAAWLEGDNLAPASQGKRRE